MSKYLDSNGLLYLWGKIKDKLSGKVDKVDGMGLSANDFTDADKEKLAGLENYSLPAATADTLGGVKVGTGLTVDAGVLSAAGVDWDNVFNKPDVALKSDLTQVYRYKGSVTNYASLPTAGNVAGDVWNVEATGMNYAWTGEGWDALGETFSIESIANAEIDAIMNA